MMAFCGGLQERLAHTAGTVVRHTGWGRRGCAERACIGVIQLPPPPRKSGLLAIGDIFETAHV